MANSRCARALTLMATLAVATAGGTAAQVPPKTQPYTWKSVQMVGGGFVDGIVFHPTAKGVCYARTDIGALIDGIRVPGGGNRFLTGFR